MAYVLLQFRAFAPVLTMPHLDPLTGADSVSPCLLAWVSHNKFLSLNATNESARSKR